MKTNLHKFSTSIKKITHYLHSPLQIYEHFNRFINIFKHCRQRSLAAVSLHKRLQYCTQIRMPPNMWSVVIVYYRILNALSTNCLVISSASMKKEKNVSKRMVFCLHCKLIHNIS